MQVKVKLHLPQQPREYSLLISTEHVIQLEYVTRLVSNNRKRSERFFLCLTSELMRVSDACPSYHLLPSSAALHTEMTTVEHFDQAGSFTNTLDRKTNRISLTSHLLFVHEHTVNCRWPSSVPQMSITYLTFSQFSAVR